MKEQTVLKSIFDRLLVINDNHDTDEAGDLMLEVQEFLIGKGVLNKELQVIAGSKVDSEEEQLIVSIFTEVRREYQADDEKCEDFSYLSVAFEWLYAHGIKVKFM